MHTVEEEHIGQNAELSNMIVLVFKQGSFWVKSNNPKRAAPTN
jgi:hypothetical protein